VASFDNIDHAVVLDRVRARISDKRVVGLVRAFLKAGVLTDLGTVSQTEVGTPQGGLCTAVHKPPYEQRWVMRSARRLPRVVAVVMTERCA
jgi:retron-type reverse transcriptase